MLASNRDAVICAVGDRLAADLGLIEDRFWADMNRPCLHTVAGGHDLTESAARVADDAEA